MTASTAPAAEGFKSLREQLRTYDDCFGEFLQSAHNGQKHVQSILLRESFKRFQSQGVGIKPDAAASVLDVSCGPGGYTTAWTSQVSQFLPHGMEFFCTDFKGGKTADGTPYPTATANAMQEAAQKGDVKLAAAPVGIEADLFSGTDTIIPPARKADIVHWSHSGYHVRDALGSRKNDQAAITEGLNTAIDKMWDALGEKGLMFSVHQTGDKADGLPSDMFPVASKYLNVLHDVPARIERRIAEKGGHVAKVHFATPLNFPTMADGQWESLKDPAKWEYLDGKQARTLRLLSFVLYDFSDASKSGLEKLAEDGKLAAFIDEYKN
ncbi:MAG: hypothetical protein K2Q01_04140, partial [Rickettsiales bacterium]|nr:hypothetical protein [Rickettsiales bacterium]